MAQLGRSYIKSLGIVVVRLRSACLHDASEKTKRSSATSFGNEASCGSALADGFPSFFLSRKYYYCFFLLPSASLIYLFTCLFAIFLSMYFPYIFTHVVSIFVYFLFSMTVYLAFTYQLSFLFISSVSIFLFSFLFSVYIFLPQCNNSRIIF